MRKMSKPIAKDLESGIRGRGEADERVGRMREMTKTEFGRVGRKTEEVKVMDGRGGDKRKARTLSE